MFKPVGKILVYAESFFLASQDKMIGELVTEISREHHPACAHEDDDVQGTATTFSSA